MGIMRVDDPFLASNQCCESGDTEQFSSPIQVILKMFNQDKFHRNTCTKSVCIIYIYIVIVRCYLTHKSTININVSKNDAKIQWVILKGINYKDDIYVQKY